MSRFEYYVHIDKMELTAPILDGRLQAWTPRPPEPSRPILTGTEAHPTFLDTYKVAKVISSRTSTSLLNTTHTKATGTAMPPTPALFIAAQPKHAARVKAALDELNSYAVSPKYGASLEQLKKVHEARKSHPAPKGVVEQ